MFEFTSFTKEKLLAVDTKQQISSDYNNTGALTQYYESVFFVFFCFFTCTHTRFHELPTTNR